MHDRDLAREFNIITEQYKMSPFGFRLRRTGMSLKLIEHNGLLYIDNDNLFKIVNELLGPNIPEKMKEYLPKITFSEVICIEASKFYESLRLTCVQFIDHTFFDKCCDWLKGKEDYMRMADMDRYFFEPMIQDDGASMLYFNQLGSTDVGVNEMFPFKEMWKFDNYEMRPESINKHPGKSYYSRDISINQRPRGKQMILTKDSLKERPYVCEVLLCERAFKRYEHLKRHMKMHTGDKPFKCAFPGCNKSFSRSDNQMQHMKTHSIGTKEGEGIHFKHSEKNSKTL